MNVWANQDGAIVTAELPGINPEDIDISVQDDTLVLRGSRTPEEVQEGVTYHRQERGSGSFTRSLQLPFQVEQNQVEASYARGILSITLPRAEADKDHREGRLAASRDSSDQLDVRCHTQGGLYND